MTTDSYESFDVRAENPTRWQSVLNNPDPLVKGDPVAIKLVCWVAVIALCVFVGYVAWPGPRS